MYISFAHEIFENKYFTEKSESHEKVPNLDAKKKKTSALKFLKNVGHVDAFQSDLKNKMNQSESKKVS